MPSDGLPTPRPRRALRSDSHAASEAIGYILVFGILSMILILSMMAFNVAQQAARSRAVELRAESAATRVAGVVVQTAVLGEQQGSGLAVAYRVDLPDQLEGYSYTVYLDPAAGAPGCLPDPQNNPPMCRPDEVRVRVPALNLQVTAPIFSAAAPAGINICNSGGAGYTSVPGGPLNVRFNGPQPIPIYCANNVPAGPNDIFIQATP